MTTENVSIALVQGESPTIKGTIRDANGVLVDLTGATIQWKVRKHLGDVAVVLSKTVGSGITITGIGLIEIALSAGDTAPFLGRYHHECRVTIGTVVFTAFRGFLVASKTII